MSQTKKALKKIASGEEYKTLVEAVEEANYEAISSSYRQILELLEEEKRKRRKQIESLPRKNKEETWQKFLSAFDLATKRILPLWHQINSELQKRKVMEGEVFGFGSKGDPLVKTPEGRIVVLRDSRLKEGERVRFKVVSEGEKIGFGKVFELTPDSLYFIFTQDVRERLRNSLNLAKDRFKACLESLNEGQLPDLKEPLKGLEEVEKLASELHGEERERIIGQVLGYRKRLLKAAGTKLMFDLISQEEEKEIENFYQHEQEQKTKALSAPGLFRRHTFEAVKRELFIGDKLQRYSEVLKEMEERLDSMDSALELLEFKSRIKEAYPKAKRYLEKMDQLFDSLVKKTKQVTDSLAEKGVSEPEEIRSAIKDAFSEKTLLAEFRKVFRSAEEFFALRGALLELRKRVGNPDSSLSEAAIRPYLRLKVSQAFKDKD